MKVHVLARLVTRSRVGRDEGRNSEICEDQTDISGPGHNLLI